MAAQDYGPVYLVYAGPYSSSPASAFGHLFLAIPDYPGQPETAWRVITFGADSEGAGPLRYLVRGVFGGFDGGFDEVALHEKTREYGVLDDRPLWALKLDLDANERTRLDAALERRRDERRPYTFFVLNCAFYLQRLLAEAVDEIPAPRGVTSPSDVMDVVMRSGRATKSLARPSEAERLRFRIAQLPESTRSTLLGRGWRESLADSSWIATLPDREAGTVHEALAYKAATSTRRLGGPGQRGLGMLRTRRADSVTDGGPEPTTEFGAPVDGLPFHRYTRWRLGGAHERGTARIALAFRPAMHDAADNPFGHGGLNALEILSLEVSTPADRFEPRVDRAALFSQRSLTPRDWLRPTGSWSLELVAHRGGLFAEDRLHWELRSGSGRTFDLGADIFAYGLAGAAAVVSSEGDATLAPGLETGISWVPARMPVRVGVTALGEVDVTRIARRMLRGRGWLRFDLGDRVGLTVTGQWGDQAQTLSLGLDVYR